MAIRIHCYENIQNDSKMMKIHIYKNGNLVSSANKMPYCERTIKLYARGHKVVELVNVAKSRDLNVKEIMI